MDIAIPPRVDSDVEPREGLSLLDEINDRQGFIKPGSIVCLTAYRDIYEEFSESFTSKNSSLLLFDREADNWQNYLIKQINSILNARDINNDREFKTDFCVVTALRDPELKAFLELDGLNWERIKVPYDNTNYFKCIIKNKNGESREVIAASAPSMGMTFTAVLSAKMLEIFQPRYLVMIGILGGIAGQVEIGDIVVANPTWNWESGKMELCNGKNIFHPSPHQIPLLPEIRSKLEQMSTNKEILNSIKGKWSGRSSESPINIVMGPVACGASVLANPKRLDEIKKQHRKLSGVEMEIYGLYAAAYEARMPEPKVFAMKSVSDFADEAKNDDFQEYASFVSALGFKLLVENYF